MTAAEVYRLQRDLERLEEANRDLPATGFDPVPLDGLYRSLTAAQEAVGGVVYRVANAKLDDLRKKLDTLNKRAKKHDLGKLLYYVTDEEDVVEVKEAWNPEDGPVLLLARTFERYTYVVLSAPRLKLAGWTLLAKLSVEEAGVFVTKVPAFARAWSHYREGERPNGWNIEDAEVKAQAELEAINLADYTDPEQACRCDHCGLARRRTATYVVENIETGERKQVGSNCLRDFLGVDPHAFARWAEYLVDLDARLGSDDEDGFGRAKREIPADYYLANVAAMIRIYGWTSRSSGGDPTADRALANLHNARERRCFRGVPTWDDVTEADVERATAAVAWADEYLGAKVNQTGDGSDFDRNLYVAAKATVLTDRIQGTLAYLPVAHARYLEREIERAREREQRATSEHVGQPGARVELTLTVASIFEHEGDYGTKFITTLHDEAGNAYKWFGTYGLDRGSSYTATWTIKRHEEWKGEKQTVLTRPAKLRPADEAQARIEVPA